MSAKEVVQQFCDGMVNRDAAALRPLLADEVVYQNAGMPASEGIEATLAALAFQFEMFPDSYEYARQSTPSAKATS
jgi:limonene-1,2-epoxide hydrolase